MRSRAGSVYEKLQRELVMETSEQINELAEALSKAQGKIENAKKDSNNPFHKSKYADLASVREAYNTALTDNGLSITQFPEGGPTVITITTRLMHKSGQWIQGSFSIEPKKEKVAEKDKFGNVTEVTYEVTPQTVGSALTYARRYGLMAVVGIAPDDDDDANRSSGKAPEDYKPANNAAREQVKTQAETIDKLKKENNLSTASELPPVIPSGDLRLTTKFDYDASGKKQNAVKALGFRWSKEEKLWYKFIIADSFDSEEKQAHEAGFVLEWSYNEGKEPSGEVA
jgi:hypothetical protein